MKNLLPSRGFTLVELLVVIAIMAILSVIGVSIYGNVQRNARDGVRRAEIASLAKSIESTRDPTVSTYTYTSTNYGVDYPKSKPADPRKDAAKPLYCVATSAAATATTPSSRPPTPSPTTWADTAVCPTDAAATGSTAWSTLVDSTGAFTTATTSPISAVKYWMICAKLENGNSHCVESNQP